MPQNNTSQCKILIVPEEGWFAHAKYGTHSKKSFNVARRLLLLFSEK